MEQLSLFCECTPIAETQYDPAGDESPVFTVIRAVAAVSGEDPESLTPLADSIDPDSINQLFSENTPGSDPTGTVLSFTVNEWNVFIRDDGQIRVCDPSGPPDLSPIFD